MQNPVSQLEFFRERWGRFDNLFERKIISEMEFSDGVIGYLYDVKDRAEWPQFFTLIPESILPSVVQKMEEVRSGGFTWVLSPVGGFQDPVLFRQFTVELYPALRAFAEKKGMA